MAITLEWLAWSFLWGRCRPRREVALSTIQRGSENPESFWMSQSHIVTYQDAAASSIIKYAFVSLQSIPIHSTPHIDTHV